MAEQPDTPRPLATFRDALAWTVFLTAILGILFISSVAMYYGFPAAQVFSAIVPLFGTWVGTILAFYFARENFESANASLRKVVDRLTPDQQLTQAFVREVMKPRSKIIGVVLTGTDQDLKLDVIRAELAKDKITRLPIFDGKGAAKYIIHGSTLNKFIADNSVTDKPADIEKLTLSAFLDYSTDSISIRSLVSKIAFCKIDSTLAEARERMVGVVGAQDVIVTRNGVPSEPVEGWLTNADIARVANI